MHLVREHSPQDYRRFCDAFDERVRFVELTPADRNLAWRELTEDEHFHEWPVPMDHFLNDPYYLGEDIVIRPTIREFLTEFWGPEMGYELFIIIAGLGVGKGLALDTPLPTPSGWTTMGELEVGDELFDEEGRPCRVTWVSDDRLLDCYRVTFDDGEQIVCDADHLWTTIDRKAKRRAADRGDGMPDDWRDGWDMAQTHTVVDLQRTPLSRGQRNHLVPNARPLDLPEVELPVDPYVLGAWAGDGTTMFPSITTADPEIVEEIESRGWVCSRRPSGQRGAAHIYGLWPADDPPRHTHYGMAGGATATMREMGLLTSPKHIPKPYLRASREQRLDLLKGIMDTDGFIVNRALVGIDQCNEQLASDICELIASLGWKFRVKTGPAMYKGKDCGPRFRINFRPDCQVFNLSRKREAWTRGKRAAQRTTGRTIDSVEEVPSRVTRCIRVDSPRELFLAGKGMVPTHNSFSATICLLYAIYQLGCLKKPARYLSSFEGAGQLSGDAEIVLMNASGGGYKQAQKIVYKEALERVVRSPWFRSHFEPYEGQTELEFPNRVRLSPGTSHWESALGWNLYGFILDEAAFGIESKKVDYMKELFNNLNLRRKSRFGRAGFGGLFTSPGAEHGFIEVLAGDRRDPHILVKRTTTWEAKEEMKPGASVFLLDRNPDKVRIVAEELTYVRPGVCRDSEGNIVRYGTPPKADEEPAAV